MRLRARVTRVHVSGRITALSDGSRVRLTVRVPALRVAAAVAPTVLCGALVAVAVTALVVQWFALVAASAHVLGAIPSSSLNPVTITAVFGLSILALVWLARTSVAVAWSRRVEPLLE
ncbi:MAG: hypothetical protein JOZ69_14235, partial [Myxococcales bacterium]|nr:hypothetical protein [Myxococcales bacterium]